MRSNLIATSLFVFTSIALAAGCSGTRDDASGDADSAGAELRTPGKAATDKRAPELGNDLRVLANAKTSLVEEIENAERSTGPVIEAKFELGDDGKLSLSVYPAGKDLSFDAERNVFQELSGDPTVSPFAGGIEKFEDEAHLLRSARDLTLVQLSRVSVLHAAYQFCDEGTVFWTIPTVRHGRAGYGVYTANGKRQRYHFVDGGGSSRETWQHPSELGEGPGAAATDARTPELGDDLSVLASAKVDMKTALAAVEPTYGAAIEAKYELGDDGKLSLSIYPVKDATLDAERSSFGELAGDPTTGAYTPSFEAFKVPDVEHLTRSARDLTLVQTASLSLRAAVDAAQRALPGGFVYWAIPTIRDTRAGYGVYVFGTDKKSHYFFIG